MSRSPSAFIAEVRQLAAEHGEELPRRLWWDLVTRIDLMPAAERPVALAYAGGHFPIVAEVLAAAEAAFSEVRVMHVVADPDCRSFDKCSWTTRVLTSVWAAFVNASDTPRGAARTDWGPPGARPLGDWTVARVPLEPEDVLRQRVMVAAGLTRAQCIALAVLINDAGGRLDPWCPQEAAGSEFTAGVMLRWGVVPDVIQERHLEWTEAIDQYGPTSWELDPMMEWYAAPELDGDDDPDEPVPEAWFTAQRSFIDDAVEAGYPGISVNDVAVVEHEIFDEIDSILDDVPKGGTQDMQEEWSAYRRLKIVERYAEFLDLDEGSTVIDYEWDDHLKFYGGFSGFWQQLDSAWSDVWALLEESVDWYRHRGLRDSLGADFIEDYFWAACEHAAYDGYIREKGYAEGGRFWVEGHFDRIRDRLADAEDAKDALGQFRWDFEGFAGDRREGGFSVHRFDFFVEDDVIVIEGLAGERWVVGIDGVQTA
jgi:hypothetical protein